MKLLNFSKFVINAFKPKLKFAKGTRFVSFLFIGVSVLIAAGVLFGASIYYNIDTGEVVTEQISRVTGVLRATAGLIVSGTASQNPSAGYGFEVATSTKLGATTTITAGDLELTAASQALKFSGGTSYYTGFRATTSMTTTTIYWLPAQYATSDYVLTYQAGNQLEWTPATELGLAGDISAIGDVASGDAFTAGGTAGKSLYFHNGSATGTLTVASLTANATYTLPDIAGTNYLTLTNNNNLGTGGILFSSSGLLATSSSLYWNNANSRLGIGTQTPSYPLDVQGAIRTGRSGTAGQLIISNDNGFGFILQATSTMAATSTYYWPSSYGSPNYVLTTDGTTGNLVWSSVSGVGGVQKTGTPLAGQVAFFLNDSTIMGDTGFSWASSTDALTISGSIISPTYTSAGTTTLSSAAGQGIVLDPASGKIALTTGDWIETASGYQLGKSGTEVLREMIPIFGFDLPAQTATTTFVQISRTITSYPFAAAATGSTRVHKLVIRYTDVLPTASSTNWRIATSGGATSTFTLAGCNNATLDTGKATTTNSIYIPTDTTSWWLEVQSLPTWPDNKIKIFQVFLAAYDRIQ